MENETALQNYGEFSKACNLPSNKGCALQAELVHTHRTFRAEREWVVITHHKGFVRLAIEEGAALVPVVVMGEVDALRNLIDMPRFQVCTPLISTLQKDNMAQCMTVSADAQVGTMPRRAALLGQQQTCDAVRYLWM